MQREALTRRRFLGGTGAVLGGTLARAGLPGIFAAAQAACTARDEQAAYRTLTSDEAQEIIAIAARILPTTDTPGATEAGAVYFFDTAFSTFYSEFLEEARSMHAEFQADVRAKFPGAASFSALSEADQDAQLASIEDTPFFETARYLTLAGVFAMSHYGGNRDDIGYKLVGMDGPPHAWVHPFGYYDSMAAEDAADGR